MKEYLQEFCLENDILNSISEELNYKHIGKVLSILIQNFTEDSHRSIEKEQLLILTINEIIKKDEVIEINDEGVFTNENSKIVIKSKNHELQSEIQESSPRDLVGKLKFIKALSIIDRNQDTSKLKIKLSPFLRHISINKIKKVKLDSRETTNKEKIHYDFFYIAHSDNGEEFTIENKDFFKDKLFIKRKDNYYLIPQSIYAAVKKQTKYTKLSPERAQKYIDDPLELFPSGTDTELIDLSLYSKRVKGFEKYVPRQGIRTSKFSLDRESNNTGFLKIRTAENIEIDIPVNLTLLVDIRTKIDLELMKANELRNHVLLKENYFIQPSHDNLDRINFYIEIIKENSNTPEGGRKLKNVVVVDDNFTKDNTPDPNTQFNLKSQEISLIMAKELPVWFKGLKPHQEEGINWILERYSKNLGGCLLADDMGLGKTLQILIAMSIIKIRNPKLNHPCIIICPTVLLNNWEEEKERYLNETVFKNTLILHDHEINLTLKSNNEKWYKDYDLIITNYHTFSNYQKELLSIHYLVNVFDESQNIKNYDTARSRAARGIKSEFTICATGTPVENSLQDVWNQISCLNIPGNPLGSIDDFDFEDSIGGANALRDKLGVNVTGGIVLRRDKELLRKSGILKGKIEHPPAIIPMTKTQEEKESTVDKNAILHSFKRLHFIQKLYQHEFIISKTWEEQPADSLIKNSPKLKLTIELIEKNIRSQDEKVLIFAHFTEMQEILKKTLESHFKTTIPIINGKTNSKGRKYAQHIINKFSKEIGFGILILSPLAAGAGLNIVAANHVIHYGRWWNPAKEDQATDRAYRIGQKKTVHVYYPILTNSTNRSFDQSLHEDVLSKKKLLAQNFLLPIQEIINE